MDLDFELELPGLIFNFKWVQATIPPSRICNLVCLPSVIHKTFPA